jgi:hypothetical protein
MVGGPWFVPLLAGRRGVFLLLVAQVRWSVDGIAIASLVTQPRDDWPDFDSICRYVALNRIVTSNTYVLSSVTK